MVLAGSALLGSDLMAGSASQSWLPAHGWPVRPVLAHPFAEPSALALPPWSLATLAVALIVVVARVEAPRTRGAGRGTSFLAGERARSDPLGPPTTHRNAPALAHLGPLTPGAVVARTLTVAVLALLIATGRLGRDVAAGNLAPSVAMGLALPASLMAVLVRPRAWVWLDPFDALGRAVTPLGARTVGPLAQADVRIAGAAALGWVWFLAAHPAPFAPSAVGAALALYVVVMVAGCLAFGRVRWLATAEVFGVLAGWVAQLRADGLRGWVPPRGAELVLGVLAGGLVFASLRSSRVWFTLAASPHADLLALAGLLGSVAGAVGLLLVVGRRARPKATGLVAAASVPTVVGIALAASFNEDRLVVAALLLPSLLSDPFGAGWDLFGTADAAVVAVVPLEVRVALQVTLLVLGGAAGVLVSRGRTTDRSQVTLAAIAIGVLVAAGVLAVTAV